MMRFIDVSSGRIWCIATALLFLLACTKNNNELEFGPDSDYVELSGELTTMRLTADKKYLLKGLVFVRAGQTLIIDPGTVIFGEKRTKGTLIIDRGGKIIAEGRADAPIVMTSNQAPGDRDRGDWGGLVILGNASVNQVDPAVEGIDPAVFFGGNPSNTSSNSIAEDDDNSGVLKYVRVEFAGIELSPNNETNGITFGGVGRGTVVSHVQVSFGGDDGIEWFGGTVNAKHLVVFNTWDDCFDIDYGWSGNVQFALSVRYPSYADQSGSNAIESDNGPNDNDVQPYTTGTFSNLTAIGPIKNGTSISNGNFQHSIDLRRRTAVSILNSVFTGFPRGLRFNQASVAAQYLTHQRGVLENNLLISPAGTFQAGSGVNLADIEDYWTSRNETISGAMQDDDYLTQGLRPDWFYGTLPATGYPANPNFTVTSGTIAVGADFSNPKFAEPHRIGFFEQVSFRGAFGDTDWTDSWTEWQPIDKNY